MEFAVRSAGLLFSVDNTHSLVLCPGLGGLPGFSEQLSVKAQWSFCQKTFHSPQVLRTEGKTFKCLLYFHSPLTSEQPFNVVIRRWVLLIPLSVTCAITVSIFKPTQNIC